MSNDDKLAQAILKAIEKKPHALRAYDDLFSLARETEHEDFAWSHALNRELRGLVVGMMSKGEGELEEFYSLYRKTLLFDARSDFDSYMLYLELDRKAEERFYQPRRRTFMPFVRGLQELADDELDELFLSTPPRSGKTSLVMFFLTWVMGRNSEGSNLYSAFSDTITRAFYNGLLEILGDRDTYLWHDVFPSSFIAQTNAADETINLDRRKRYPSVTCRSLYGTLNGACDCNSFLISDDLLSGYEEALNPERLVGVWGRVENNLLTRAKEGAKILWIGTRWSLSDPMGVRDATIKNDAKYEGWRMKHVNVPALDENDESNFDYDHGVGFSTVYYLRRRASFERNNDMPSWAAQYMGEPIEREGTLFKPEDFRYYNGELPVEEAERIFMAVDPAFGGGDFVAAPVCYQYGEDVYVHDVVYDDNEKNITQPLVVAAIVRNGVQAGQIEATKATESYKEGIEDILRERGLRVNLITKPAPNNKTKFQRIFDKAPDIRENFIFRESGKRTREYELFMQNVFSYKILATNKNDDAPDSLAMAANMVRNPGRVQIFKRLY